MSSKIVIAFIDPIISPAYLTAALKHKQISLVGVYSQIQMTNEEKKLRLRPELFDHVFFLNSNDKVETLVNELKKLNVSYVFYGYEASVPLTDKIAQAICPQYANNCATSSSRFDKFAMQDVLEKNSLPHIQQMKIQNNENIHIQLNELKNWHYPIFIKPTQGILSIGVKKCISFNEVVNFFETQKHTSLHSDTNIEDYVAQECLIGDEYFVDTFSLEGNHYLASVQHYHKEMHHGSPIYRFAEMMNPTSNEWKLCFEYVFQVLDAVELHNGFAHTELFLTNKGPALIEVNPRISGASGFPNLMAEKTLNTSQPKILLDKIFNKKYETPTNLKNFGRIVSLQNWSPKRMGELNINLIKSLPSYSSHLLLKKPGTMLGIPSVLSDTIAFVLLINQSQKLLLEDYDQLIKWEKDQLLF